MSRVWALDDVRHRRDARATGVEAETCYKPAMPPEGSANAKSSKRPLSAKQRSDAEFRVGWKLAAVGMEVASMVVAGALLGWGAEALWGWKYSILVGALTGLAVGLWTLIKGALKLNQQLESMGPRPRKPAMPAKQAPAAGKEEGDDDSWREEWNEWIDDDAGERDSDER